MHFWYKHNYFVGRGRKYFEYEAEMSEIFGKKKNINPEILLSTDTKDTTLEDVEENTTKDTCEEDLENQRHEQRPMKKIKSSGKAEVVKKNYNDGKNAFG